VSTSRRRWRRALSASPYPFEQQLDVVAEREQPVGNLGLRERVLHFKFGHASFLPARLADGVLSRAELVGGALQAFEPNSDVPARLARYEYEYLDCECLYRCADSVGQSEEHNVGECVFAMTALPC
jgi:hypothetical protein